MKNRVTLLLDDGTYKLLRVMAATQNTSMSAIVEDFVAGRAFGSTKQEDIDMAPQAPRGVTFKHIVVGKEKPTGGSGGSTPKFMKLKKEDIKGGMDVIPGTKPLSGPGANKLDMKFEL